MSGLGPSNNFGAYIAIFKSIDLCNSHRSSIDRFESQIEIDNGLFPAST